MNRLTTTLFGIVILALGAFQCIAEEMKPGPDYEQLKALEWMIGDWEADWVVPSEGEWALSGFPAGAKVHSTCSYSWMENKNYIGLKFRDEIDGEVAHEGFEIVGVDPESKKIVHWLFSILGGRGNGEWTVEGKTWKLKWWGTTADESELQGDSYMVSLDFNTHTWEIKNAKKNGKSTPDTPLVTYHRVIGKKPGRPTDVSTAEDYIAMQTNYFVGEWVTKVIEGEDSGATGTWTCRLDPSGKSFHETATSDGKPFLHAIGGYDPRLKAFKEVVFYADGGTATLLYRHPLKKIQGSLVGKVLTGTMQRTFPDGKKESLRVLVNPTSPNRSILTIHQQGDPDAVVVKVVFERKKE